MKKIVAVLLVLCMTLTFLAAVAEETAPAATVFETADGVRRFDGLTVGGGLPLRCCVLVCLHGWCGSCRRWCCPASPGRCCCRALLLSGAARGL